MNDEAILQEIMYDVKSGHNPTSSINLTDLGNAMRLVARDGEDLRYVYAWNRFLVWDGRRFRLDESGEVERRAKETVRAMYHEADPGHGGALDKELAKHALKSEARGRIEAMIALAQSEQGIPIIPDQLDRDPWLLNTKNGTVDLRTGDLRSHQHEDLITKLAGTEFHRDAEAPTWKACLERWLPSQPLRKFVQRVAGYALTGDVSEQVLLFLYGVGANGKSTFINALLEMLGDYGMQSAPDLLTIKGNSHPTELADLMGARFVATVEVEEGKRLAESLVKQMTGGDRIKARFMRQDFFEFEPTHKVFLAANHKPVVRGTDHAIWRRIKLVPFEVTIPAEDRDPQLAEKLRAELPGILAWAVRGCLEWQAEGLGEPEEVRSATETYRAEMDVIAAFIDECCVVRDGAFATASALYQAYTDWCEGAGERRESQRRFGERLRERGYERRRVSSGVNKGKYEYLGIGLVHGGDPPENWPGGEPSATQRFTDKNSRKSQTKGTIPNTTSERSEQEYDIIARKFEPRGVMSEQGSLHSLGSLADDVSAEKTKPRLSCKHGVEDGCDSCVEEINKLVDEGTSPKIAISEVFRDAG
jgi:putative DNA primase/helicase